MLKVLKTVEHIAIQTSTLLSTKTIRLFSIVICPSISIESEMGLISY